MEMTAKQIGTKNSQGN